MKQLELFLSEMEENPAHIAALEAEMKGLPAPKSSSIRSEVRKHYAVRQLPKREAIERVPWPPHMRFRLGLRPDPLAHLRSRIRCLGLPLQGFALWAGW